MDKLFSGIYHNKNVLVTGHTGFKGSWLSYWLKKMGANVIGYSLEPPTSPNHFELLGIDMVSVIGDIRDTHMLNETFAVHQPEIVFHLAAQPLVRYSYENPVETYETNVIGTLKVFEACRANNVKAIVNITSDKCYDNQNWVWGYRENDPMGGYDPYSSSKGCAELLTSSYRDSYFHPSRFQQSHHTLLASCRAGNVIGGGDWAQDRLMTDIVLSIAEGKKIRVRNPSATRPWQHVLEPLSGYLMIGQKLLGGERTFAEGWNFGPSDSRTLTVGDVLETLKRFWNELEYEIISDPNAPHEAGLLKLDSSKAHTTLHWQSVWNAQITFQKTAEWYQAFYRNHAVKTDNDLVSFVNDARIKGLPWAN